MSICVLDTSVAVAWYLPERFASAARQWQSRMLDGELRFVVPSLHFWEFGNVLRTYVRRGELDLSIAERTYRLHLDAPLEIIEPQRADILKRALEYDATVYDAVYIELALSQRALLLTAERSTRPWVVKLGTKVRAMHE